MPKPWDTAFDQRCRTHIETVCSAEVDAAAQKRAWQALLTDIAPHIERWVGQSPLLARCGLHGPDEPRAILVAVLSRLSQHDHKNLARFLDQRPAETAPPDPGLDAVEKLARLGRLEEADEESSASAAKKDDTEKTPFRAWLITLVKFATKDHIRQRLGWSSIGRVRLAASAESDAGPLSNLIDKMRDHTGVRKLRDDDGQLHVEYTPGRFDLEVFIDAAITEGWRLTPPAAPKTKRAVGTDARPLSAAPEGAARPPMTDYLTFSKLLKEIDAFTREFPERMRAALELWQNDEGFDAIAERLDLEGPKEAKKLVRAAHARLRNRFRDRWPALS